MARGFDDTALGSTSGRMVTPSGGDGGLEALPDDAVRSLFLTAGVLQLRGFDASLEAFIQFTERHGRTFSNYDGGLFRGAAAGREIVGDDPTVLTTTGGSQGFSIPLHGEMYYLPERPEVLWFFCEQAPASGGATTLCDGVALLEALRPDTRRFFTDHRIAYIRRLRSGEWQQTFGVSSVDQIHAKFDAANIIDAMEWKILDGDALETRFVCAALIPQPDGRLAFVNNLIAVVLSEIRARRAGQDVMDSRFPIRVRTASGERIPREVFSDLRETAERLTHEVEWRSGDVLMVDNRRYMHGRRETDGSPRRIYVRMARLADGTVPE